MYLDWSNYEEKSKSINKNGILVSKLTCPNLPE